MMGSRTRIPFGRGAAHGRDDRAAGVVVPDINANARAAVFRARDGIITGPEMRAAAPRALIKTYARHR